MATGKDVRHARTPPPEFRQCAVRLAREGSAPVAKIAKDLGISESCPRNGMAQADADENGGPRLTSAGRNELADLRRKNRLLAQENEILALRIHGGSGVIGAV